MFCSRTLNNPLNHRGYHKHGILSQKTEEIRHPLTLYKKLKTEHCVKSVRIRSYPGQYFPAFGLNTERYSVSLRIQSECGKIRTRITPNTDTFHVVEMLTCDHDEFAQHIFSV